MSEEYMPNEESESDRAHALDDENEERKIKKEIKLIRKRICVGNITLGKLSELPYYVYSSKDVEESIKNLKEELKEIITESCLGTSANCYLIKKDLDKLFKKYIGELK